MSKENEQEVEALHGEVEGEGVGLKEQRDFEIAQKTYEKFKISVDWSSYGSTELTEITGAILLFRSNRTSLGFNRFTCGAELAGALQAYQEIMHDFAEHGHRITSDVESLAAFLGIDRSTLMAWMRGDGNPEFVQPLALVMNEIGMVNKELGKQGKIPNLIYLSDMQNNHGYLANSNKTEVHVNVKREGLTDKQLIEEAKLLP